jgi:excisionase family DNA binding protein
MNTKNLHPENRKSKKQIFSHTLLIPLELAGEILSVSSRTVRRMSQRGELPEIVKVGNLARVNYQAVLNIAMKKSNV